MKKLHLDLDQLAVESFDTAAHGGARPGTVRGNEAAACACCCCCPCCCTVGYSCGGTCYEGTCGDCPPPSGLGTCVSCDISCNSDCYSCNGSCYASCYGSCDYSCNPGVCDPSWGQFICLELPI